MKLKHLLFGLGLLAVASVAHARPVPTWRANLPLDGRHAVRTAVTVSTFSSAVVLSTDATRQTWYAQVSSCTAGGKVFWDTVSISTDTSAWVQEGDYFTSDDPFAWQGPLYLKSTSIGCTAIIYEYKKEEIDR